MEETIGYEALFSPEEWDEIDFGYWYDSDHPGRGSDALDLQLSSGVAATAPGSAAHGQKVAPEDPRPEWPSHEVRITGIEVTDDEQPFRLECSICEDIGAADTLDEAQAIARLHAAFVATLVETWSVER